MKPSICECFTKLQIGSRWSNHILILVYNRCFQHGEYSNIVNIDVHRCQSLRTVLVTQCSGTVWLWLHNKFADCEPSWTLRCLSLASRTATWLTQALALVSSRHNDSSYSLNTLSIRRYLHTWLSIKSFSLWEEDVKSLFVICYFWSYFPEQLTINHELVT